MDLIATHHTNEIAQSHACSHKEPVNYWIHTNMLTLNGQRMSKSTGNTLDPRELASGLKENGEKHPALSKGYSPMVTRFFMMQTHYHSTLDFSDEALQAAEKGFHRLMNAVRTLGKLKTASASTSSIEELKKNCYAAMNDDFNSPILLSHLFEGVRIINSVNDGKETISAADLETLKKLFNHFVFDVLGLKDEEQGANSELLDGVMKVVLDIRQEAKIKKDFTTSDKIRNELARLHITINDTKEGASWSYEN